MSTSQPQVLRELAVTPNGDVAFTGHFDGEHVWSKRFGDAEQQGGVGIAVFPNGDIAWPATITAGGAYFYTYGGIDNHTIDFGIGAQTGGSFS